MLAKRGDTAARLKLGESYLVGTPGVPRNLAVGLGYLQAALPQARRQASVCMALNLSLRELVGNGLLEPLKIAAEHEDAGRQKLAAWHLIRGETGLALACLERCSGALPSHLANLSAAYTPGALLQALQILRAVQPEDIVEVMAHEAGQAVALGESPRAVRMLEVLADLPHVTLCPAIQRLISDLVHRAEEAGHGLGRLAVAWIEISLDRRAAVGDPHACHALGRALAGLPCAHLAPDALVHAQNLRKAAALLLRAADGGIAVAWLHLFRICSDYRSSVANPALARFCLEKAAQQGLAEAERRLGALVLRDATCIESMEHGIALLHAAADKNDALARSLLHSLTLPVDGSDEEAFTAIEAVRHAAPLLAMRLRLARVFGLTKREALSVDPLAAQRPWGMVVGSSPFVAKARLCGPRAVPATTPDAQRCLQMAASMFSAQQRDSMVAEGSLRARSLQMRRLFHRLKLKETVFFASASSNQREAIRVGTKWARRQQHILKQVLA
jgi:TPR repeat protein